MHFSTVVAVLGLSAASTVLAMPASQIFARQGGCSSNADCPSGDCCSQYGYCGSGSSYCGSSGGSGGGSGQGSCSSNSDCPSGECCSQYGYCGSGSSYCGSSGGGGGGSTGQTYTGEATVNPNPSGADGSCGDPFLDSQFKVAISNSFMQGQSPSPYCGKQITLTNTGPNGDNSVGGQGNTVTVTVDDTCEGCDEGHLDLSVAAWNQLTDNSAYSHVGITWSFVS